jgi:hypothetical protein
MKTKEMDWYSPRAPLASQRLAQESPTRSAQEPAASEDEAALIAALRASLAAAGVDRPPAPPMMPSRTQRATSGDGEPARKLG